MIQFTIDSFSGGISGRPYNSIKDAIKTVATLFGVMKKLNLRLVLGTERKKILKDIANTISVKL